jgi:hypothetical protein
MAQGKAWDKEKVIEALRPYFILNYSVTKACSLAQIPQSTVQTWIETDEELRLKITAWQGSVAAKSRENIAKKIQDGDLETSKWYAERVEKEQFSTRLDLTNKDESFDTAPDILSEILDELRDKQQTRDKEPDKPTVQG